MKTMKMMLAVCLFCTLGLCKGYAQASCSGGARSGWCSASSDPYSWATDIWVMNCPTGNLQYSMSVYRYDANSTAQAIMWGDGPNINLYTDPSHDHLSDANTLTGLSTTQDFDIEVEVLINGNGSANISVFTW